MPPSDGWAWDELRPVGGHPPKPAWYNARHRRDYVTPCVTRASLLCIAVDRPKNDGHNRDGLIVIRTFVAIEIPETMRLKLSENIAHLKQEVPARTVRWVRPEGIHLTLKFLGDVPVENIKQISATLEAICLEHMAFSINISEFGCFPNFRRPRVLWIGVQDLSTRLAPLQADIEDELIKLGFERETRPFHPHLTIGRVKKVRDRIESQRLTSVLEDVKIGDIGQVHVVDVSLMRSDLKPTGAAYTRLVAAKLGGGE